MGDKPTPSARLRHLQMYNTKLTKDQKHHMIRRVCQHSNWPFTGDLMPGEIVCMRDTYCGKRQAQSCIPPRSAYDSLYHPRAGWNQWATKDTRENFKDCQYSANQEDKHRTVVVCANSTYGHYLDRFIDFTFKDHGHYNTCKEFHKNGPISTLPPITDLTPKYPHDG